MVCSFHSCCWICQPPVIRQNLFFICKVIVVRFCFRPTKRKRLSWVHLNNCSSAFKLQLPSRNSDFQLQVLCHENFNNFGTCNFNFSIVFGLESVNFWTWPFNYLTFLKNFQNLLRLYNSYGPQILICNSSCLTKSTISTVLRLVIIIFLISAWQNLKFH